MLLLVPSAASADDSIVLRWFGTPTVDGLMATGEWDSAAHADFTVNRAADEGGGTVPATLYEMNDGSNLYLGLKISNATIGASALDIWFGSVRAEGSDHLGISRSGAFEDEFMHEVAPSAWQPVNDVDFGGSLDGGEAEGDGTGYSFYELVHPLDDGDDAHDFSLATPLRVSFNLSFSHCPAPGPTCALPSRFPASSQADVVVVSGSRIAPETTFTSGPPEGAVVADSTPAFAFTGSDDRLSPADLIFECKLDEDAWHACQSPDELALDDGKHVVSARAIDEMLNVDATPAQRTFTVDTTGPTLPVVRGLRALRTGRGTLRFSAKDQVTRAGSIRFKCAVDSAHLKRCSAVYRVKLRPGRHVVRVRAVDGVGNQGDVAAFRVRVKRPHR
jgi:hypothetical protein